MKAGIVLFALFLTGCACHAVRVTQPHKAATCRDVVYGEPCNWRTMLPPTICICSGEA